MCGFYVTLCVKCAIKINYPINYKFNDEIDEWVIDAIKSIGLDTAKQVLEAPREMLVEKADLEESTVDNVLRILKAEFEDDNVEESEGDKEDNNDSEPAQPEENNE